MKPKTKIQIRIMGLSQALPKYTKEHTKWAEQLHDKYVVKHYNNMHCLECTHTWKYNMQDWTVGIGEHHCPGCNSKLKPIENKSNFSIADFYSIVSVVQEFQVVRYFTIWKEMKKKQIPRYFSVELYQEWNDYKNKMVVVGLNRSQGWTGDGFSYGSNFDIKEATDAYGCDRFRVHPSGVYPNHQVLPIMYRNGFRGNFHDCSPRALFKNILQDNIAETLLKIEQSKLLFYYIHKEHRGIQKYWKQIKICFKHGYKFSDFSMWYDYMENLSYFKKDINNPKHICPENLHQLHNELMIKREKARLAERERRDEEYKLEQARQREMEAISMKLKKKQFSGFKFSDKLITVQVLLKVSEFAEEGKKLAHCVRGYHKKKDSLILSARIDNEPVETVEISLSRLTILQARGHSNRPTEYHDRIVNLVTKNLPKIQRLINKQKAEMKPKKKTVKTKLLCQTA